ncbi:hypothetical protein KKF84_17385 [Myxococcota bacterium]|nr:hypothetical protein [Myxococcota bacterium]MBU1537101.1 hypothetical protein [Myxococcota bacterium]
MKKHRLLLTGLFLLLLPLLGCDDTQSNNTNNINNTNNVNNVNNLNNTNNVTCGNQVVDPGEDCDTQLAGETCEDFGFVQGTLACGDDCNYDFTGCSNIPLLQYSLDILFVVDDSLSMSEEQLKLRDNFNRFVGILKDEMGVIPSLHVGIITTSVSLGRDDITTCQAPTDGKLMRGVACANPMSGNFIADVEPKGCEIERSPEGQCTSHTCTQQHCAADAFEVGSEPDGLALFLDDDGCPRCRNYENEGLTEVFSCMADVGVEGCGFEQPLEALHLSYTAGHQENEYFFRDSAYLAVVFVSDEDDCSAQNQGLFDPASEALGNFGSFRCTQWGIACDQPWDTGFVGETMDMTGCVARPESDSERLLYPISRYVDSLIALKGHPAVISLAAIVGPTDGDMTIDRDTFGNPHLMYSCTDGDSGAVPGIRFHDLVTAFTLPADREWAFYPVCESDYSPALEGIARNAALAMMEK